MAPGEVPTVPLPAGVVLLDGGMGQELRRRGLIGGPPGLWSANALLQSPETVLEVHRDYIRAGARIITTNTYSTKRPRLEPAGIGGQLGALNRLAGELACRARDELEPEVLIAGSLAPLYGSYRPDLVRPFAEILPLYSEQAEILAPYVDVFLCETMSSAAEARAAAAGAASTGKPVWVAWTLDDRGEGRLRSGESVSAAAATLVDLPVSGFLANCCAPESITAAMPELASLGPWPCGGYANGFAVVPAGWGPGDGIAALGVREDLDPDAYARHAEAWIAAGARLVGGCCEIGPEHIARLRELVEDRARSNGRAQ
jgi:S-methylmethionine-dependent homocysteine/selenocysteine methylase